MNWNYLTPYQQSLQVVRALKALSAADGDVDPRELSYIRQAGLQHGLTSEDIEEELRSTEVITSFPKDERERMTMLYYLIFLMKSDNQITPAEEASIHHFGFKLGIRDGLLRHFIALASQYRGEDIPPEEMIDKIRVYLN